MSCDACDDKGLVWVVSPFQRRAASSLEAAGEKVVESRYAKPGHPYEVPCPECHTIWKDAHGGVAAAILRPSLQGGVIRGSGLV